MITLKDILGIDTHQSINEDIRSNFIKRRKEMKLSREKLAKKAGLNVGIIRRYEENGYISLSNLIDLAFAMGYQSDLKKLFSKPYVGDLYNDKK